MTTTEDHIETIAARLQRCLPDFPINGNLERHIAELGLDSMDTVELLCAINEEFGVRLTDADFNAEQTLGGLLAAVAIKANSI
jgi:acyl carrier protein